MDSSSVYPSIERLRWSDFSSTDLTARLSSGEAEVLARWPVEKRRRDWLLGRAAAKQSLRAAFAREGLPPPDWTAIEVRADSSGAPRAWISGEPSPLAVSLSHGHGEAAAWALRSGAAGGLPGVDLELLRPRRLGTLRFYLHPEERERVLELPGCAADPPPPGERWSERDLLAILYWSLKEAAFKALRPPRGHGLLDIGVRLSGSHRAEEGAAEIVYRDRAAARAEALGVREVRAGWRRDGDWILAWALARGGTLGD